MTPPGSNKGSKEAQPRKVRTSQGVGCNHHRAWIQGVICNDRVTVCRSSFLPHFKVRARFVERFSMGAPFAGGEVVGPAIGNIDQKVSWVEKFVAAGAPAVQVWTETVEWQLGTSPHGEI